MRIAFGLQAGLFRVRLDFGPAGLDPSVRERGARWVFLMWFSTSHLCDCTMDDEKYLAAFLVRSCNLLKGAVFGHTAHRGGAYDVSTILCVYAYFVRVDSIIRMCAQLCSPKALPPRTELMSQYKVLHSALGFTTYPLRPQPSCLRRAQVAMWPSSLA